MKSVVCIEEEHIITQTLRSIQSQLTVVAEILPSMLNDLTCDAAFVKKIRDDGGGIIG